MSTARSVVARCTAGAAVGGPMIGTSTNTTVRALADSPAYPMAQAGLRMGRQKFGRTFLDLDDPERTRLRRIVTARCSIKVVGALRCRGTPINFRLAPNGS